MEPHPNTIKMQQINRKDRLIFNTMIDRRKKKKKQVFHIKQNYHNPAAYLGQDNHFRKSLSPNGQIEAKNIHNLVFRILYHPIILEKIKVTNYLHHIYTWGDKVRLTFFTRDFLRSTKDAFKVAIYKMVQTTSKNRPKNNCITPL